MTAPVDLTSAVVSLVRLLPRSWQNYAKTVAATLFAVVSSVLPALVALGVDLPPWVAVVTPTVLGVLGVLAVRATPNVDGYKPRHGQTDPDPATGTA